MTKALFTTLALSASLAGAQAQFPLTLRHDLGTTTLQAAPKRVVVLSEEAAELLAVLNVKPVGFGSARLQGAQLGERLTTLTSPAGPSLGAPQFVGSSLQPSIEAILALKPDLIVMLKNDGQGAYGALSRVAPTLAYDFNAGGTGWRKALSEVGKLFGREAQARRYLSQYDARVQTLKTQLAPVTKSAPRTTLLYLFQAQNVMALGEKFAFANALKELGLALNMPSGVHADTVFSVLSPEALVGLQTDRALVLRLKVNGALLPRTPMDDVLARAKVNVVTYPLDPQEPSTGPLTDLKRVEAIAKLLKR